MIAALDRPTRVYSSTLSMVNQPSVIDSIIAGSAPRVATSMSKQHGRPERSHARVEMPVTGECGRWRRCWTRDPVRSDRLLHTSCSTTHGAIMGLLHGLLMLRGLHSRVPQLVVRRPMPMVVGSSPTPELLREGLSSVVRAGDS